MPATLNDGKHWRDRAAEMRALSDMMKNEEAVGIMLRLADDYDKLGDRAEQRTENNLKPLPSAQGQTKDLF